MLSIILKCTEYCNAACVYCAVSDKELKKETRMSIDTLGVLFERIRDYLALDPKRRVNITWHGGEPLLMGARFYRTAFTLREKILGDDASRLQFSIQSNLTLLNQELAEALLALGIRSFGTSYDYTPNIRGIGLECDSERYQREFFQGLAVARKNGMSAGVIFVVTSRTVHAPLETMVFLGNLLGKGLRGHVRINPLYAEGEASKESNHDLYITPEQYGHFLGVAYQYWYPRRHILTGVAPFSGSCKAIEGNTRFLSCEESGNCGNTHLSVSPRGNIYQCGRAMDNETLKFGNISERTLDEVFAHPIKADLLQRSKFLLSEDCAGCAYWKFCHGGCPVDSFIYHEDWRHRTYFCAAKKIFYGQYALPLHGMQAEARS